MIGLLRQLTDGCFRDGARARIMLMEHWTAGHAPTFQQFARQWLGAERDGRPLVVPEWAYLSDRRAGRAGPDWKHQRAERAGAALRLLATIEPDHP